MLELPPEQAPVLLSATIPGFVHHAGYVLAGMHGLIDVSPGAKRRRGGVEASVELELVVERAYDDVATLVPVRVVSVVRNHVPLDGVVIRVYCGHMRSLRDVPRGQRRRFVERQATPGRRRGRG